MRKDELVDYIQSLVRDIRNLDSKHREENRKLKYQLRKLKEK